MNYGCMHEQYGWDNQTFKCLEMLMQYAIIQISSKNNNATFKQKLKKNKYFLPRFLQFSIYEILIIYAVFLMVLT